MSGGCVRMVGVGLLVLTPWLLSAPRAAAVVHCGRPGVPAGCVVRPRPAVGAPGVGAGAPGVGVAPANRGGPVNRAGVR